MTAPTTDRLTPALMRSLRTLTGDFPRRTVPQYSRIFTTLYEAGYVTILATRYGHGAGRHTKPLWEVEITDAGRAALGSERTAR